MEELSKEFALYEKDSDDGLDINAIFRCEEDTPAPPLATAGKTALDQAEYITNEKEIETQQDPGIPENTLDYAENTKSTKKQVRGKKNLSAAGAAEPDNFSAFKNEADVFPTLTVESVPAQPAAMSLFDRLPVFSYGGHKDRIEDASQTFDELRIAKADDFPELEDGKTISWKVRYGEVTRYVDKPKEKSIASVKDEIEKSKQFLDSLKKGKVKNPDCLVIPSVTAKSKGSADYKGVFPNLKAARESDKLICLLPAKDGRIYEMRRTEMGEFVAPKNNVVDFSEIRAGFFPALPPIPWELMGQIITFFRSFMKGQMEYEALVYIYWDRQEEEYVVFVPRQTTSKASVHTCMVENSLSEDRYLLYADVHSHNSMEARFSPVDDKDEKATRLYLVIGKLDRFFPEVTARVSCGGTYLEIDPNLVIAPVGEKFPTAWLDQVTHEYSQKQDCRSFLDTGYRRRWK